MPCYIVIFELRDPSRATAVKEVLKTFNGSCPLTARAWAIVTDMKASEVREKITPAIGAGARLFVLRSGTEGAWRNSYGEKHNDWLKKNL